MFGKGIRLFKLLGFSVKIDLSWLLIALLITWSLAKGYFPANYSGLTTSAYWLMGLVGAVGFFLSIVFHELCHSLVARLYGLPMRGITLFVFGGVAEMEEEPATPKVEFLMSVVGPLSSIDIGFVFYGLYFLAVWGALPVEIFAVLGYLAAINFLLAIFNLIPAFPLDGGRILRSILWRSWQDLRRATRVSANIGTGFGYLLIAFAFYNLLGGNFISAVWWFLIGMFIRSAAQMTYRQLLIRRALEGEPISRFMKTDLVTVPPSASLQEFVDDYLLRHHFKLYPVTEGGRLVGCVTPGNLKSCPRTEWGDRRVADVMTNACAENALAPDTDAVKALAYMRQKGAGRVMVTEGERLVGIISLKDLLEFLAIKMELGE